MAEEEKLKVLMKSRSAARGWMTRASRRLESILNTDPVDIVELQDAVEEFDKRLANLDEVQTDVELQIPEEQLDDDVERASDFREEIRRNRIRATKKLADDSVNDIDSVKSNNASNVKLPRLELPKFSGVLTEWQTFWEKFTALVHDTDLPDVSKFSYLQSLLEGEAKAVLEGLAITVPNYAVARKLLEDRYGRKERIIFAHIQGLLHIVTPQNRNTTVSELWKLQDELLKHVRSLESLGILGKEYGMFLTPVILSRLPNDIRMEWARDGDGKESDLDWLLSFLRKEIERRERSEVFKNMTVKDKTVSNSVSVEKRSGKIATASALASNSQTVSCHICGRKHLTEKCWDLVKIPFSVRHTKINEPGLCFRTQNSETFYLTLQNILQNMLF